MVEEDGDLVIEVQCELSCDPFDECGLGFDDCLDVCAELVTWEPESCEQVTADY